VIAGAGLGFDGGIRAISINVSTPKIEFVDVLAGISLDSVLLSQM